METKYVTITALTKYLKKKMDMDPHLQTVFVRGEISNFKLHSRGHMYLTIKDEGARIQAVMFSGNNRRLLFSPENGMKVLIKGQVTVFEAFGQYQLYIQDMEPDGIGALYLAFEQLKNSLSKEGLFDNIHKKSIPKYPEHIGIITSKTGAAIRDILSTIQRRYPIVNITVFPVHVQGELAVPEILQAIYDANNYKSTIDTLIIARGGGSIEDLWAFNEEKVVRAVYDSVIPIISGVGHETDTSLVDFVADLRAATPTGAAELAVPSLIELHHNLQQMEARLITAFQNMIDKKREQINRIQQAYAFHKPMLYVQEKQQYVDYVTEDLIHKIQYITEKKTNYHNQMERRLIMTNPQSNIRRAQDKLNQLHHTTVKNSELILQNKRQKLELFIHKLTLLNPLHTMKRGFSIPYSKDGSIIKNINQVQLGEEIDIRLVDGIVSCTVDKKREE